MKRYLTEVVFLTMAVIFLGGVFTACSLLTKQETTTSNIPSAETLTAACNAGKAQTPPIRAGSCDDFDLVQSGCIGLTNQPLVPASALIACTANGYVTSGNWTRE